MEYSEIKVELAILQLLGMHGNHLNCLESVFIASH